MLDGGFTVAGDYLISTRLLMSILKLLEKDGIEVERLQETYGLPIGISEDKYRSIELDRFRQLLGDAQRQMGGPAYGLRMAEVYFSSLFTKLVHLFLTTESIFSSFCFLEERLQASKAPNYIILTKAGNDDKVIIQNRDNSPHRPQMMMVFDMGLLWKFSERVAGDFEFPVRVKLAYPQDNPLSVYQAFFGSQCEISFDCEEYALIFSHHDFRKGNPIADVDLQHRIKNVLRGFEPDALNISAQDLAQNWPHKVRKKIEAHLPHDVSIDSIAETLHISPRTLQRKLKQNGLSYSRILEECRKDLSLLALRSGKTVAKVASELGYSSVASFRQAFLVWYGTSPSLVQIVTDDKDDSHNHDD
ncbi:AraC family transcriptional regulator [Hahella ganghwensis]|uniref:AraC family transcriptional regulator n=1 Tax=Hahella ganghwensis TaxID=286420 RepID=UPI00037AEB13|nr:AraC family transcriptional regulator [Hahella ganghwensis]